MEAPDLHNFGQSVQKVGRGSETLFQKPRPIYWEWLFFGKNSPLSIFFEQSRSSEISPGKIIFNLITHLRPDYSGGSLEVLGSNDSKILSSHFYSLGVLLAYCYVFGIRDLHRHNLIKTTSHLQVVDAEVVFSRLLLPHESLLLPFKEVGTELCGARAIVNLSSSGLAKDSAREIFDGYMDVFESLIQNREDVLSALNGLRDLPNIPIRHILRDTFHYRAWKKTPPPIPFFESELLQLERGDIPYYFKFLNRPEVFEYVNRQGDFAPVNLPEAFVKGAAREAQSPADLLAAPRLQAQLFGPGFLYLAKTIFPVAAITSIEGKGYSATFGDSEVRVSTSLGDFAATRR